MRKFPAVLAAGLLCTASVLTFATSADARREGGGVHMRGNVGHVGNRGVNVNRNYARNVNRDINRNVSRNVNRNVDVNRNVNRQYVYRNGKRGYWRNGVWVAVPLAAGAYGYVASCSYEYNRWKSTGSSYWRDRYYACAG